MKEKMIKIKLQKGAIVILFILSLYMVEFGPYSSNAVAQYNSGFGTFDMKYYDPVLMDRILSGMNNAGFQAENRYYLFDYIFIVMLFLFQYIIGQSFISNKKNNIFYYLLNFTALIRGIADGIENALLLVIINSFPDFSNIMVSISYKFTMIKLMFIKVWVLCLIAGVICKFLQKRIYINRY